jgi:DDE superfamily endonuclease
VWCLDESDVPLLPVVRAMGMRRGQQARVLTPGTNRKRAVFGALEWQTGRWLYQITERKRASEFITFIAFLEQRRRAYPGQPLLLVLDNASIHNARGRDLAGATGTGAPALPAGVQRTSAHPGREGLVAAEGADRRQSLAWLHRCAGGGHSYLLHRLSPRGRAPTSCLSSHERLLASYLGGITDIAQMARSKRGVKSDGARWPNESQPRAR